MSLFCTISVLQTQSINHQTKPIRLLLMQANDKQYHRKLILESVIPKHVNCRYVSDSVLVLNLAFRELGFTSSGQLEK